MLKKYILQFGQIHAGVQHRAKESLWLGRWVGVGSDKYILQFRKIQLRIWTNVFFILKKIQFAVWTNTGRCSTRGNGIFVTGATSRGGFGRRLALSSSHLPFHFCPFCFLYLYSTLYLYLYSNLYLYLCCPALSLSHLCSTFHSSHFVHLPFWRIPKQSWNILNPTGGKNNSFRFLVYLNMSLLGPLDPKKWQNRLVQVGQPSFAPNKLHRLGKMSKLFKGHTDLFAP